MEHHEMVSDLYQKNMQKVANSKKWRNIVNIIFILLGSLILAINMNTFVEQGNLVPGGIFRPVKADPEGGAKIL